ncbi:hypothetical protein NMG60_11012088 [Bertholletia excelsa]
MGGRWEENWSADPSRALVEELEKGRDFARKLRVLLQEPTGDFRSVEELLGKIYRSFDVGISVLSSGEVHRIPAMIRVGPAPADSGESRKWPAAKDQRGCYKRRKTSDSRVKLSPTIEDGHAWRKYGQKDILNARFPRCYFRCTHKPDQGCKATRQVQRVQEEPIMYQITYFGHHTCNKNTLISLSDHNYVDDSDPVESYLVSFDQSDITNSTDQNLHFYPLAPPMKAELKEEAQSNISSGVPPAADFTLLPPPPERGSEASSASTSSTPQGFELEFLNDQSDEFESDFHLPEFEFL